MQVLPERSQLSGTSSLQEGVRIRRKVSAVRVKRLKASPDGYNGSTSITFDIRHRKGSSHGNADALSKKTMPRKLSSLFQVETKYDYAIRQITTSTATPPIPGVTRKFEKTRWRI
ncbi:hypothetical protein TNCV_3771661 [Trichonephila clavipes]|nr:hypothetical protein TNCV_3771661 [Trichonephila clavipes]